MPFPSIECCYRLLLSSLASLSLRSLLPRRDDITRVISYDVTTSIFLSFLVLSMFSLLSPALNAFVILVQVDYRCILYRTISFFLSHRWRKGCEPERISPSEIRGKWNPLAFYSSENQRFPQIPWCRNFFPRVEVSHRPSNTSPTTPTHE